jgi:hypothetical protein
MLLLMNVMDIWGEERKVGWREREEYLLLRVARDANYGLSSKKKFFSAVNHHSMFLYIYIFQYVLSSEGGMFFQFATMTIACPNNCEMGERGIESLFLGE